MWTKPPDSTRVPNIFFDLAPSLKESELKVLLAVLRLRPEELSLSSLIASTGLSRTSVVLGVKEGLRRGSLIQTQPDKTYRYIVFNECLSIEPPLRQKRSRTHIAQSLRLQVYERDNYQCKACPSTVNLTIDHIQPQSLGGVTVKDNLQTLCRSCNSRKGELSQ